MTPGALVVLSIVLIILGAFLWAWGVDEYESWAVAIGITLAISGICGFVGGMIWHSEEIDTTTVQTMNVDENLIAANDIAMENQAAQPPPEKKEEKLKDNATTWPRKWPGNDAPKNQKDKWWTDWATNTVNNESTIVCKDGTQIVVFGNADGDTGETSRVSAYVRVHPDGKPFTCDESKDPSEEITK